MRIVAVIPVKDKSDRVESKNFREFTDNISLTELKIRHLMAADIFDKIYISSDSNNARELADKYNLTFLERDERYCNNIMPWSDVIFEVVNSLPEDNETTVAWCHTTSPLFENYKMCVEKYIAIDKTQHNGLVTVAKLSEFILSEKAKPINYHWGVWHEYSQNLDKLYAITGGLFVASKEAMLKNRYVISTKPYLYEVSPFEAIDVDTAYDFQLAKLLYTHRNELTNA